MTTEADVLRTLLSEPHKADLRLIAADWLEENNDPRGELLRLTHELTQAIKVSGRARKEACLQALLASGVQPFVPTITNSIGMKLALIPAGTFLMGSRRSEVDRYADEGPRHEVVITQPFYMGVYPVTQREYEAVLGVNPSHLTKANGGGPEHPVEQVSWADAMEFCRRLSALPQEQQSGRAYRLPTEAEWEYACRAGTTTPFHFGSSFSSRQANFDGNYPYGGDAKWTFLQRTSQVGSYPPNAFGLYDMHGNVCEWCAEWYAENYYQQSPQQGPQGPQNGDYRVLRGGSLYSDARNCRASSRGRLEPGFRINYLGFRLVCVSAAAAKRNLRKGMTMSAIHPKGKTSFEFLEDDIPILFVAMTALILDPCTRKSMTEEEWKRTNVIFSELIDWVNLED